MYCKLELDGLLLCEHDVGNKTKESTLSSQKYELVDGQEVYFYNDGTKDNRFLIRKKRVDAECDGRSGIFFVESDVPGDLSFFGEEFGEVVLQRNSSITQNGFKIMNVYPTNIRYFAYAGAPYMNTQPSVYNVRNFSRWMSMFVICNPVKESEQGSYNVDYTQVETRNFGFDFVYDPMNLVVPLKRDLDLMHFCSDGALDLFTNQGGYTLEYPRIGGTPILNDGVYRDTDDTLYAVSSTGTLYKTTNPYNIGSGVTYTSFTGESGVIRIKVDTDDNLYILSSSAIKKYNETSGVFDTIISSIPTNATDFVVVDEDTFTVCNDTGFYSVTTAGTSTILTTAFPVIGMDSHDTGKTIIATLFLVDTYVPYISTDSGASFTPLYDEAGDLITENTNKAIFRCRKGGSYFMQNYATQNLTIYRAG